MAHQRGDDRAADDSANDKATACWTVLNTGELFINILGSLSPRDLAKAQIVSHYWRDTIQNEMQEALCNRVEMPTEPFMTINNTTRTITAAIVDSTSFASGNILLADSAFLLGSKDPPQPVEQQEWHPITINNNLFEVKQTERRQVEVDCRTKLMFPGDDSFDLICPACDACSSITHIMKNSNNVVLASKMRVFPPEDSKTMDAFITNPPIVSATLCTSGYEARWEGSGINMYLCELGGITCRHIYEAYSRITCNFAGTPRELLLKLQDVVSPTEEIVDIMRKMEGEATCCN